MTINEKQIEYYRTKIIGKYLTPVMNEYANEEIEYKKEQEQVICLLKEVRKNT